MDKSDFVGEIIIYSNGLMDFDRMDIDILQYIKNDCESMLKTLADECKKRKMRMEIVVESTDIESPFRDDPEYYNFPNGYGRFSYNIYKIFDENDDDEILEIVDDEKEKEE